MIDEIFWIFQEMSIIRSYLARGARAKGKDLEGVEISLL